MTLTVLCVFVRGHVNYSVEYVYRLRDMAHRLLPPHRFACLTDRPAEMPRYVEPIPVPSATQSVRAWWSKLRLFDEKLEQKYGLIDRLLYLDLDVVLLGDMEQIIHFPAPFALIPDGAGKAWRPPDGKQCVRKFNSSVMVWNAGTAPQLYRDWSPQVAQRLWGDQDWIGSLLPKAATMPLEWFPRMSACGNTRPGPEAKVMLCKTPKNIDAAARYPWVKEAWA